ncbi:TetR/AcrR family transcriptional regulator [Nocardia camponoti]|uniref:HTH-type transcriptional repressor n=1 Tax=Nocardia camponoti TaxID=1616106 RepID=A0A917Q8P4_9NOCA|nr:TetR/AcrR family transcriptional regulator [Nocardia camponoti]GGK35243.1 HTH-type transcriptional repressor [Nocardia camponoti]
MTTGETTDRINPIPTPVGRAAIRAAVLEHAAHLFAERGPNATSVRDIAERAGINHGLVFRHFGAKDNLIGAVLDHLGDQHDPNANLTPNPGAQLHVRVLVRCLLDGYPVGELQHRFPIMEALIERAKAGGAEQHSASLAAANAAALLIGWEILGPFLRAATGLDEVSESELRANATTRAAAMLDHPETIVEGQPRDDS